MGRYVFQDHFNIFSRNEKVELKNCSPIYYVGKKSCMAGQKVGSTYIAQIYIYIFHCHRVAVFLPQLFSFILHCKHLPLRRSMLVSWPFLFRFILHIVCLTFEIGLPWKLCFCFINRNFSLTDISCFLSPENDSERYQNLRSIKLILCFDLAEQEWPNSIWPFLKMHSMGHHACLLV